MKINEEQRLYVIPCGSSGYTCLGFDVAAERTKMYAAALEVELPEPIPVGTEAAYALYQSIEKRYCQSEYCRTHTTFDPGTSEAVQRALEDARVRRVRVKLFYGKDGKDWHEENDVTGYVGRTMGPIKAPIIVANNRSNGGGTILTACVVKIVETVSKRVLYQHPNYQPGVYETRPAVSEGYAEGVWIDNELHAQFKKVGQAERWIRKMRMA